MAGCGCSTRPATRLHAQTTGSWELGADVMQSAATSRPGAFFGGQSGGIGESALSLRATADLLRVGAFRLRYAGQFLPVIRLSGVEQYGTLTTSVSTFYVITGRGPAYGVGLVPLGLDLEGRFSRRVQLGVGAGVGIAAFSRHVPVAASRRRAFTAEWGTRLRVELDRDRAVLVGVRWKHTSNGLTAWENPGVDSRLITAGFSWKIRAPR